MCRAPVCIAALRFLHLDAPAAAADYGTSASSKSVAWSRIRRLRLSVEPRAGAGALRARGGDALTRRWPQQSARAPRPLDPAPRRRGCRHSRGALASCLVSDSSSHTAPMAQHGRRGASGAQTLALVAAGCVCVCSWARLTMCPPADACRGVPAARWRAAWSRIRHIMLLEGLCSGAGALRAQGGVQRLAAGRATRLCTGSRRTPLRRADRSS